MKNKDECQELKNIKYRGMLEHHNSSHMSKETTENLTNMEDFLQKEKQLNENIPWAKLDKIIRIKKINEYADEFIRKNTITDLLNGNLKLYLRECLDKKLLNRVKDVIYDKEKGYIESIPLLIFNKVNKNFTLKQSDKRTGTSKCLAPKKHSKTRKAESKAESKVESKVESKAESKVESKAESKVESNISINAIKDSIEKIDTESK
jgi:hypothetical protein